MNLIKKHLVFLFILFSILSHSQGLRTLGKNIINLNGDEVLLRGVGLGGWMLQEPYMFNYSSGANTQHEFKEKLNNLVGSENTELFFESWLDNFVTEQDVDSLDTANIYLSFEETFKIKIPDGDLDQLKSIDENIVTAVKVALDEAQSEKEKQKLMSYLKSMHRIYQLVIDDAVKYRDEISSELRKLTQDNRAVNVYLDSSRHID